MRGMQTKIAGLRPCERLPACNVTLVRNNLHYLEVATPTAPPRFRPRLPCSYLAKSPPQRGCLPVTSSPPDSALTR